MSLFTILILFGCDAKKEADKNKHNYGRNLVEGRHSLSDISSSFKDTDGDGFGDFKGVIEKMDYIDSLGINMVWMNPFLNHR